MNVFKVIKENDLLNNDYELEDCVKYQLEEQLRLYKENMLECLIGCESPIEQMLSLSLATLNFQFSMFINPDLQIIGVENQSKIEFKQGKYRVDFLIPVVFYKKIHKCFVIECDGYEFHQKTKEQVAKDNKKTRELEKNGYTVIKFSGSEIFNSPELCAFEILKIIVSEYKLFGEECGFKKNS